MNIPQFIVLGTLDRISPASGYEIIRDLEKKMVSRWTNVKKGSIYHALKALEKAGLVVQTDRLKQGLYPTSTLYKITAAGREAFDRLQAEAFLGLFPDYLGFKLALKFNVRRTANEIAAFGEKALKKIEAQLAGMDAYVKSLAEDDPRRASDPFFIEHDRMLLKQEKKWIEMAVERIRKGQTQP
ncbi:MAG: PadR family transcriptional regulator [Deltaproteobacteria bacterium]|nr:PadR family transcriptional regulator [Deltaproteobacteria bacterium]